MQINDKSKQSTSERGLYRHASGSWRLLSRLNHLQRRPDDWGWQRRRHRSDRRHNWRSHDCKLYRLESTIDRPWWCELTQGNSVVLDGTYSSGFVLATAGNSDVTAATSSLLFNFSATDHGFFGIQQGAVVFSGEEYWCNAASGNGACYSPGASVAPVSNVDASFQVEARTGNEVIGTVNATPLPSTWLMLLSGFVGLGFFAYRGTKKAAALAAA